MAKLKLGPIADDKPVKVTLGLPATTMMRSLQRAMTLPSRAIGSPVVIAMSIPPESTPRNSHARAPS